MANNHKVSGSSPAGTIAFSFPYLHIFLDDDWLAANWLMISFCLCRMLFLQNASHLHSVVSLAVTLRLILAEGAIALSVTLRGGALFAS